MTVALSLDDEHTKSKFGTVEIKLPYFRYAKLLDEQLVLNGIEGPTCT